MQNSVKTVTLTPVITAGAYSAGDVVGPQLEFPLADPAPAAAAALQVEQNEDAA